MSVGLSITVLQDIQVSNFVALVGTIDAGVTSGGSRWSRLLLLKLKKCKKNL